MSGVKGRAMVITHESGVRFAAKVGAHRIIVDQPTYAGGNDTGPAPIQLLGAALGTCVALYVQQFCETRNLAYEGMRVEVEQIGAKQPNRIGQFVVRVILPEEIPSRYADLLEVVARSCPAHNTLALGSEIAVRIESPAGQPA